MNLPIVIIKILHNYKISINLQIQTTNHSGMSVEHAHARSTIQTKAKQVMTLDIEFIRPNFEGKKYILKRKHMKYNGPLQFF